MDAEWAWHRGIDFQYGNGLSDDERKLVKEQNLGCYDHPWEGGGEDKQYHGCKDFTKCSFLEYVRMPNSSDPYSRCKELFSADFASNVEKDYICDRQQCVDNYNPNFTMMYMVAEVVFVTCFTIELCLRLIGMRSARRWFTSLPNILDLLAVTASLTEVIIVPLDQGGFRYEVWGTPGMDHAHIRFFRVLVFLRFITMQRNFIGIQVMQRTVKKVYKKMAIPLFFFTMMVVFFASIIHVLEKGTLSECPGGVDGSRRDHLMNLTYNNVEYGHASLFQVEDDEEKTPCYFYDFENTDCKKLKAISGKKDENGKYNATALKGVEIRYATGCLSNAAPRTATKHMEIIKERPPSVERIEHLYPNEVFCFMTMPPYGMDSGLKKPAWKHPDTGNFCVECGSKYSRVHPLVQGNQEKKILEVDSLLYDGTCEMLRPVSSGEVFSGGTVYESSPYNSVMEVIWLMVVTMTTVGYGGLYPISQFGKGMCLLAALLGSFYMAMPLTIIGGRFYEEYNDMMQHARMRKKAEAMRKEFERAQIQSNSGSSEKRRQSLQMREVSSMSMVKAMIRARREAKEESILDDAEQELLQTYVQACYDICQLTDPVGEDFETFAKIHGNVLIVMARRLVHDANIHLHGFARQWAGDEGESNFLA
eukprot:g185.t1